MFSAADSEFRRHLDAGDNNRAGTWLVEQCADEVLNLCTAMVRDRVQAEDLAQDAFGQAFSHLDSFRGESSPRTWLLAIARNRCLDHLRRQRRVGRVVTSEPDAGSESADDAPLPPDLLRNRRDVARALASLDEAQRALVVLRFRHGLGYDELGVAFGIKPGTARMRVSRALSRMRAELGGHAPQLQMAGAAPAPARPTERARRRAAPSMRSAAPAAPAGPAAPPPSRAAALSMGSHAADAPARHDTRFAEALAVALTPAPAAFRNRLAGLLAGLR